MMRLALVSLLMALVAGWFGFVGLAGVVYSTARLVFGLLLMLSVFSLVYGMRAPPEER